MLCDLAAEDAAQEAPHSAEEGNDADADEVEAYGFLVTPDKDD
jgi:hypothetical protein